MLIRLLLDLMKQGTANVLISQDQLQMVQPNSLHDLEMDYRRFDSSRTGLEIIESILSLHLFAFLL